MIAVKQFAFAIIMSMTQFLSNVPLSHLTGGAIIGALLTTAIIYFVSVPNVLKVRIDRISLRFQLPVVLI